MESKKEIYIIKRENGFIEFAKETFTVAETAIMATLDTGEKEVEDFESQISALLAQAEILKLRLHEKEETLKDFRIIKKLIEETDSKETV